MKRLLWPLAVVIVPAILGAAGLLVAHTAPALRASAPEQSATVRPQAAPAPSPNLSNTPSGRPGPTPTPRPAAQPTPQLTGPWAVVSAYYRDVDSGRYAEAWALIRSAIATAQNYQQFVAGYACTGTEQPTKLAQSGHHVTFKLAVVNDCTGATVYYTGRDTVRGGKIIAANVARIG